MRNFIFALESPKLTLNNGDTKLDRILEHTEGRSRFAKDFQSGNKTEQIRKIKNLKL